MDERTNIRFSGTLLSLLCAPVFLVVGGWQLRWVDNKGNASQCSGGVVFSLSAPPPLFVTSLLRYEFGGIGMIGGGEGFCDGFDCGQLRSVVCRKFILTVQECFFFWSHIFVQSAPCHSHSVGAFLEPRNIRNETNWRCTSDLYM